MRLLWRRRRERDHNGEVARARAEADRARRLREEEEARERRDRRMMPLYERMGERLAELPAEEFARRVTEAFAHRYHA